MGYEKVFIDTKIVNMLIFDIVYILFINSSTSYFFSPYPCDARPDKMLFYHVFRNPVA